MPTVEGSTSRELRERFLAQQFVPVATEILARAPGAVGVGYVVGQYWADEAEDAVHGSYVLFEDEACAWPPEGECPDYWEIFKALFPEEEFGLFDFVRRFPQLESNERAITAFASYCPEGCHQEMALEESHVLVYLAQRAPGGGVAVEERAPMIRPEWEDRFDVGFARLEEEEEPDDPEPTGAWARMIRRWGGR